MWSRRQDLVDLLVPYLTETDPVIVAHALEGLYGIRMYRPLSSLGGFDAENRILFSAMDKAVYGQIDHMHSLNSNEVLHILARYIGHDSTAESRKRLLRIAEHPASKSSRSQALVCLAHQGDPEYLEALFSFLLIDAGLAYSLRRGYGEVAIPYLLRALGESTSPSVRRAVAYELVHLEVREGFAHLSEVALADPAPQGKQSRPLDGIRQFARDYLDLPKDVLSSEAIAEHISKRMPVETDVEEGLSNK